MCNKVNARWRIWPMRWHLGIGPLHLCYLFVWGKDIIRVPNQQSNQPWASYHMMSEIVVLTLERYGMVVVSLEQVCLCLTFLSLVSGLITAVANQKMYGMKWPQMMQLLVWQKVKIRSRFQGGGMEMFKGESCEVMFNTWDQISDNFIGALNSVFLHANSVIV